MAAVSNTNTGLVNGTKNDFKTKGRLDGGSRERTVRFAKISRANIKNALVRIAHPNPTSGMRWINIIGKMTPPMEEPITTRPRAAPRFFKNHVET